jgi:hypothetical protein
VVPPGRDDVGLDLLDGQPFVRGVPVVADHHPVDPVPRGSRDLLLDAAHAVAGSVR